MDTAELQSQDAAADVETSVANVNDAPADDLDSLLSEFDNAVGREQTEPAADQVGAETIAPDQPVDRQLADLLRSPEDKQRISALEGELGSLRQAEFQRQELAAFNSYADELQKQVPSWLPEDYCRLKMDSLAHDPLISAAWELRNVDQKAANLELRKALAAWVQLRANPNADPKQIAELQRYGQRLEIAVNSHAILRKATLGILNEAKKLPKPYDDEAQELKEDIAFAMKGASAPILPDPPIAWGKLDTKTFRETVLSKYGFEPL